MFPPTASSIDPATSTAQGPGPALISDATREKLLRIPQLMKCETGSDQSSDALQELQLILEDCGNAISIDIDRLLRCATGIGNLEICNYLIEHHAANSTSRDTWGLSPVIYAGAAPRNNIAILKYLARTMDTEAFRKELDHRDSSGRTAMHYALYQRPAHVLHFCYMQGGDTEFRNDDVNTGWRSRIPDDGNMLIVLLYTKFRALLKVPLCFCGSTPGPPGPRSAYFPRIVRLDDPDFLVEDMMGFTMQWIHVPFTNV